MKTENQFFEKLPLKEKRKLMKEFFSGVDKRAGKLRLLAILLVIPVSVLAYFLFSGVFDFIFYNKFSVAFWIYCFAILIFAFIFLGLIMESHKPFYKWLWNEKDVLSFYWQKRKAEILEEPKSFSHLSEEEQKALKKEYSVKNKVKIRFWYCLLIFLFFAFLGVVISFVIGGIKSNFALKKIIFMPFALIELIIAYYFIKKYVVDEKFYNWLWQEKNIVHKKISDDE